MNSYLYYNMIFDEGFDRLNNLMEMINVQNAKFKDFLWEYHLSHETGLSPFSSRFGVSLYDDNEYSFPYSVISLFTHL